MLQLALRDHLRRRMIPYPAA